MAPPVHNYTHDVFVSYPWKDRYGQREAVAKWVEEYFGPALYAELNELMVTEPRLFKEDTAPEPGRVLEDKISAKLRGSCILLPVLGLPYFRKSWCAAEWRSFRVPGLDPTGASGRPRQIVPVIYAGDPMQFPLLARGLDYFDCSKFRTIKSPTQSFLGRVQEIARAVKQLIATVQQQPPDPKWPAYTKAAMEQLTPEEAAQWMIIEQGEIPLPGWGRAA